MQGFVQLRLGLQYFVKDNLKCTLLLLSLLLQSRRNGKTVMALMEIVQHRVLFAGPASHCDCNTVFQNAATVHFVAI